MASPIAHSLAGVTIFYMACGWTGKSPWFLAVLVVAACLPDFDLLPGLLIGNWDIFHRTFSHSIFTAAFSGVLFFLCLHVFGVSLKLIRSLLWTLAVFSHLLIDWLTFDNVSPRGIALFWPINNTHLMSKSTIFLHVDRDDVFTNDTILHNLQAGAIELLILLPVALVVRKIFFQPAFT